MLVRTGNRYVDVEETILPACEAAERVLAPGDGEAEPGGQIQDTSQPTKWATDEAYKSNLNKGFHYRPGYHLSPASQALGYRWPLPQARLRHRLGLALSPPASQAR